MGLCFSTFPPSGPHPPSFPFCILGHWIYFGGGCPVYPGICNIYSSRGPHVIAIGLQASSMAIGCLIEFKYPGLKVVETNPLAVPQ